MTSYAAKLVAKRFFKENTSNQNGYEVSSPSSIVCLDLLTCAGSLLRDSPGDQTRRTLQDDQEEKEGSPTWSDSRRREDPHKGQEESVPRRPLSWKLLRN